MPQKILRSKSMQRYVLNAEVGWLYYERQYYIIFHSILLGTFKIDFKTQRFLVSFFITIKWSTFGKLIY